MKRESDRKCVNHARVHASAQSFDRCEDEVAILAALTKRSAASGDENAENRARSAENRMCSQQVINTSADTFDQSQGFAFTGEFWHFLLICYD